MAKSILIADDNTAVRKMMRISFEARSVLQVCGEAVDGQDAIEKAQQLHPDLIVLDLSMPRMNGFEAARRLRPLMPNVPIILFTSHKSVIKEADAHAIGIDAVVSKSDDMDVLLANAQMLLERN
jgi:CheY-like chemotaxis protein